MRRRGSRPPSRLRALRPPFHALPDDVRRQIFVLFRMGLRRRMAQRRLQATRRRGMHAELTQLFAFANRCNHVVLRLLSRWCARPCDLGLEGFIV